MNRWSGHFLQYRNLQPQIPWQQPHLFCSCWVPPSATVFLLSNPFFWGHVECLLAVLMHGNQVTPLQLLPQDAPLSPECMHMHPQKYAVHSSVCLSPSEMASASCLGRRDTRVHQTTFSKGSLTSVLPSSALEEGGEWGGTKLAWGHNFLRAAWRVRVALILQCGVTYHFVLDLWKRTCRKCFSFFSPQMCKV